MKANVSSILYELEPGPKTRRVRFHKAKDAIRLLTRVVNGVINDTMPTEKARILIYASATLAKIFETTEIEDRLKSLEEKRR
jgi:hypothetical protein